MREIGGGSKAPWLPAASRAAKPRTVGRSKIQRTGGAAPKARRTRDATWVASSEWPPRAKKSSSMPARSTRSTSAQIPASTSSAGLRGAT